MRNKVRNALGIYSIKLRRTDNVRQYYFGLALEKFLYANIFTLISWRKIMLRIIRGGTFHTPPRIYKHL